MRLFDEFWRLLFCFDGAKLGTFVISEKKAQNRDIVTKKYIARGKSGSFEIELPALNASVIVELPSGMKLRSVDGRIVTKDNHVISYK